MTRHAVNGLLLLALLGTIGLHGLLRRDPTRPNREFLPEMVRSVPYGAYAPNPGFPDGKTLQPPPAGTIPRGWLPLPAGETPEATAQARDGLENPYAAGGPWVKKRGQAGFRTFCQPCHGPQGRGDGAVTRRGVPPPPTLASEKVAAMSDGRLFHVITDGQGNMAGYAAQITPEERWMIVWYLRPLTEKRSTEGATP